MKTLRAPVMKWRLVWGCDPAVALLLGQAPPTARADQGGWIVSSFVREQTSLRSPPCAARWPYKSENKITEIKRRQTYQQHHRHVTVAAGRPLDTFNLWITNCIPSVVLRRSTSSLRPCVKIATPASYSAETFHQILQKLPHSASCANAFYGGFWKSALFRANATLNLAGYQKHGGSPDMCNPLLLNRQGTMKISRLAEKHNCERTSERLATESSPFTPTSGRSGQEVEDH